MSGFIFGNWARSGIMLGLAGWVITGPNKKMLGLFFGSGQKKKLGVYKTRSSFFSLIKQL